MSEQTGVYRVIKPYIVAIDPGTEVSAFLLWDSTRTLDKGIVPNEELFKKLKCMAVSLHYS